MKKNCVCTYSFDSCCHSCYFTNIQYTTFNNYSLSSNIIMLGYNQTRFVGCQCMGYVDWSYVSWCGFLLPTETDFDLFLDLRFILRRRFFFFSFPCCIICCASSPRPGVALMAVIIAIRKPFHTRWRLRA